MTKKKSAAAPKSAPKKSAPAKASKASAKDIKSDVVEMKSDAIVAPSENSEDVDADLDSPEMIAAAGDGGLAKNAPTTVENNSSLKNFRHHPDMENFYRFIYENDLRFEALGIIDQILIEKNNEKLAKNAKASAH